MGRWRNNASKVRAFSGDDLETKCALLPSSFPNTRTHMPCLVIMPDAHTLARRSHKEHERGRNERLIKKIHSRCYVNASEFAQQMGCHCGLK